MKYKLAICLLAAFLSTNLGSTVNASEDLPTIYVTIVSHNEEPSFPNHPDFMTDYDTYQSFREGTVAFAEMLKSEGVKYDFQSDWNFLLAEQASWNDFDNTNGKNLLRWLVEDMAFAVDPHAHESTYSIADVAYLMEQLDITPSNIVGGFIATPAKDSRVEDFQVAIEGWKYNTSWEADALWGGGSANHTDDEGLWTSGIWRAQDNEHFFIDDPDSKPVIGGYTSTWDGLDDLLEKRANGELDPDKMYTANIMTDQEDAQDQDFIDEFQNEIEALQSYTNSGAIEWVTLPEALEIWETEYDSVPETYSYEQGEITSSVADTSSDDITPDTGDDTELFSDVNSNDDYYDAISYVYQEGIVEGYSDSTYRSTNSINRAEFTKILIESANPGEAVRSESCFTDVDAAAWYAKYICFAKAYNVVGGYSDGSFKPAQYINIAEALKITLETYFGSIPSTGGEWYQKYWDFAEENDYLLSDWDSPAQELSRGEMAEIIYILHSKTSTVSSDCDLYTYTDSYNANIGQHCINQVTIKGIYFVAADQTDEMVTDWNENMSKILEKTKAFYEAEFDQRIEITLEEPEIRYGEKNSDEYTSLYDEVFKEEMAEVVTSDHFTVYSVYYNSPAGSYSGSGILNGDYPSDDDHNNGSISLNPWFWLEDDALCSTNKYGTDCYGYIGSGHEFGHALGLSHPWEMEINRDAQGNTIDPEFRYSESGNVMSYAGTALLSGDVDDPFGGYFVMDEAKEVMMW